MPINLTPILLISILILIKDWYQYGLNKEANKHLKRVLQNVPEPTNKLLQVRPKSSRRYTGWETSLVLQNISTVCKVAFCEWYTFLLIHVAGKNCKEKMEAGGEGNWLWTWS